MKYECKFELSQSWGVKKRGEAAFAPSKKEKSPTKLSVVPTHRRASGSLFLVKDSNSPPYPKSIFQSYFYLVMSNGEKKKKKKKLTC